MVSTGQAVQLAPEGVFQLWDTTDATNPAFEARTHGVSQGQGWSFCLVVLSEATKAPSSRTETPPKRGVRSDFELPG